jgi:hypothetical protein
MKILFINISCILLICSCQSKPEKTSEPEEKKVIEAEWISLFDGTSTKGWRAYNGDKLPSQWVIKDKTLTFDSGLKELDVEHKGGRDIIYAAEEFDNFELYLEWKIPEGGNSGIFYHVKEGYDGPPSVAPEYQLIDDINYAKLHDLTAYNKSVGFENPSQLHPLQQTASDYAMTAADPAKKVFHPAGEWNTTRIVFTPEKAEHWLNGKKVLSFVPWSEEWNAKKNSGKWEGSPDYGKFKTGYIGLQDHDSPLWFRNIKIKKL